MLDTDRRTNARARPRRAAGGPQAPVPRLPPGGTTLGETEDKQSVLMALRMMASPPLPAARLSVLLFDQQRHDLQRLIPAVQAYLAALEAEIGKDDQGPVGTAA